MQATRQAQQRVFAAEAAARQRRAAADKAVEDAQVAYIYSQGNLTANSLLLEKAKDDSAARNARLNELTAALEIAEQQ
eukprot:2178002-Prymnesium_polylepis.2